MRGFSVPLLLIAVVLLGGFAYFSFSGYKQDNIKGAETVTHVEPGVTFSIISKTAAWDLAEYLCVTVEECLTSVGAGTRIGTASGASTDLREVNLPYSSDWSKYTYLKVLVRPSWIVGAPIFRVVTPGDVPGTLVKKIPVSGDFQDAVLIPLSEISDTYYKSATFSDR